MKDLITLVLLAASALPAIALGHTSGAARTKAPGDSGETTFGKPADPKRATRTIRIDMSDTMRFSPSVLKLDRGDTVRFIVRNSGKVLHEMVLGSEEDLKKHAELMRKFPDMEHDEPHMVHVKPGKSGSFTWQFTQAGEFRYGCLIPGHFEAGMVGSIRVIAK